MDSPGVWPVYDWNAWIEKRGVLRFENFAMNALSGIFEDQQLFSGKNEDPFVSIGLGSKLVLDWMKSIKISGGKKRFQNLQSSLRSNWGEAFNRRNIHTVSRIALKVAPFGLKTGTPFETLDPTQRLGPRRGSETPSKEFKRMKPYPFHVPFYAFVPTVQITGDNLYIKTSLFQNALKLFSHCRIVHFSSSKKTIEIKVKKWWRWQRPIRIELNRVDYIDLTYPRLSEHQKDHPVLIYDLLLFTRDPFKKINLCRFGSILSESPILRQAAENCVNLITRHTGIRFGFKPKELPPAHFNDTYICKTCGHRLHPDSEFILCEYCGGKEIEIV